MSESGAKGQVVGYARVSTTDQNLERQLAALEGVDKLFTDEMSGKDTKRPGLEAMLEYVREGDVIRTKSIDRLARSSRDLLNLLDEMKEKGVRVEFVDTPFLNTETKEATFVIQILSAVAELERTTIRERQADGIAIAKAKGVYDKQPSLTPEQVRDARKRVALGVPKAVVARECGVSRSTIYDALDGKGVYGGNEYAEDIRDGGDF